jgi:hypothetical protein
MAQGKRSLTVGQGPTVSARKSKPIFGKHGALSKIIHKENGRVRPGHLSIG